MAAAALVCAATALGSAASVAAASPKGTLTIYEFCTAESGCKPFVHMETDSATKRWGFEIHGAFQLENSYKVDGDEYILREEDEGVLECTYKALVTETGLGEEGGEARYTCENGEDEEFWFRKLSSTSTGPGLKLTPASLKAATATRPYHVVFKVSKGTPPYAFGVKGATPAGMSWNTTNSGEGTIELAGTPSEAGTSTFTVEASDSSDPSLEVSQVYTFTVGLALPGSLGKATAGEEYSRQLTSGGGTAPYHFAVSEGTLPEGVELSESGLLSGTPTHAGDNAFAITVTDSSNPALTRTVQYTLPVQLGLTPLTLPKGEVGSAYGPGGKGVQLEAVGGTPPYHYEVTAETPPLGAPGLSFDEGLFAGTPEAEGTYSYAVKVTDSSVPALTGTRRYTVKVKSKPSTGLALGEWRLAYSYSSELGPFPNFDGVIVEPNGKLKDEDFAPGTWSLNGTTLRFTLEVARGDVFEYVGTGTGPDGPFDGLWGNAPTLEKAFSFKHEPSE
jgi:Putative Ig domain